MIYIILIFIGEPFTCIEEARIPLLGDVFEKFPKTAINIDIKVNNDLLISKVCFMIVFNNFILPFRNKCFEFIQM